MLATFFRPFFDICCFRRGPQDLPASYALLGLALAAYLLTNVALLAVSQPLPRAAGGALVETTLLSILIYPVVALRGLAGRWLQTSTAMAGTGVLFSAAAVPLFAGVLAGRSAASGPGILSVGVLVLIIWNVGVTAHIFRHALSAPFAVGLLVAIAYVWAITLSVSLVLPASP